MLKKLLIALALLSPALLGLAAGVVYADEEKRIEVKVEQEDDNDAQWEVSVNGDAVSFALPDLTDGETRSVVTESGETIDVSREGNVIWINHAGERIRAPLSEGQALSAAFHFEGDGQMGHAAKDAPVVISGADLDETTKQSIRDVLASAGIDKKVIFTNHGEMFFFNSDDNGGSDIDIIVGTEDGTSQRVIKRVKVIEEKN